MSEMTRLAEPGATHPSERAHDGGTDVPGVGVLVRNEILKTRHRLAFWVGFLFFLLIVFLQSFASFWMVLDTGNPRHFQLPDAWPSILLGTGPVVGLFAGVVIVLLVSSEWTWKTARQNVIDGLSKDQFFLAKVLAAAMVVGVFLAGEVLLAGGMALWHTGPEAFPFVGGRDVLMGVGVVLMGMGYAAIALLSAFLVRSAGSAIGVFFIWVALAEQLLASGLERWEWSSGLGRYLPTHVFGALHELAQYEPERRDIIAARFEQMGRPAPEHFDTPVLFALAAAWISALIAAAYGAHRKRDL